MAGRLDDRFGLLTAGSRTALPRHQTLRAIVDWSWDLLNEAERTVLRRLSVFSGGATPGAAERVCGLAGDPAGLIDVIASLVDKSLVTATGEAEVRYLLLETVRAYATERLAEAGEAEQVRAAHAAYFLDLAEQGEPQLRGPEQIGWLARLSAEHDNFAAALRYVIEARDAESGLRFIAALAWFWIMRDYETEAGEWALEVRDIAAEPVPPGLADGYALCHILASVATAAKADNPPPHLLMDTLRRRVAPGRSPTSGIRCWCWPSRCWRSSAVIWTAPSRNCRRCGTIPTLGCAAGRLALSGHLMLNNGQPTEAAASLVRGHEEFQAIGDRWGMIVCMSGLAEVAMAQGHPDEAVRILAEARGHASAGLNANFSDMMLIMMGKAKARLGDIDGARADLERGVQIAARIGQPDDEALGQLILGQLASQARDFGRAREPPGAGPGDHRGACAAAGHERGRDEHLQQAGLPGRAAGRPGRGGQLARARR